LKVNYLTVPYILIEKIMVRDLWRKTTVCSVKVTVNGVWIAP
jgi:hypothetical protein